MERGEGTRLDKTGQQPLNPQAGRDATALPPPLLSTPRLGGSLWLPLKTLVPVAYLLPHPG